MIVKDKYIYLVNNNFLEYKFESVGPKGIIIKIARFINLYDNYYSFGFGDLNVENGVINDSVISNNEDSEKILRTIGNVMAEFSVFYKDAVVFIQGSSASRTRFYQMAINKYWNEISINFVIKGYVGEEWKDFKKGVNYEAIMGYRK